MVAVAMVVGKELEARMRIRSAVLARTAVGCEEVRGIGEHKRTARTVLVVDKAVEDVGKREHDTEDMVCNVVVAVVRRGACVAVGSKERSRQGKVAVETGEAKEDK